MRRLLSECLRRGVFAGLAAYGVAGFLALQILAAAAESFQLPPWVMQAALLFYGLGFLFTVIVVWRMGADSSDDHDSALLWRGRSVSFVLVAILALWLVLLLLDRAPAPTPELADRSVAVLPIVAVDTATDGEFANNVTEELIAALAQISELSVAARSSTFHYLGKGVDPLEAARELDVEAVIEGTLATEGDEIVLTARMLDAESGQTLWSDSRRGARQTVLPVLAELVRGAAVVLLPSLPAAERQAILANRSGQPAAYDSYLNGLRWLRAVHLSELDGQALIPSQMLERAADNFAQAARLDPDFAMAYARLAQAESLNSENGWGDRSRSVVVPLLEEAAEKALDIAPDDPEVMSATASAFYGSSHAGNNRARELFDRSLAMNPNQSEALMIRARLYEREHQVVRAFEMRRQAARLDPLNENVRAPLQKQWMLQGNWREALESPATGFDEGTRAISRYVMEHYPHYVYGELQGFIELTDELLATLPGTFPQLFDESGQPRGPSVLMWAQLRRVEAHLSLGQFEEAQWWAGDVYADLPALARGDHEAAAQQLRATLQMLPQRRNVQRDTQSLLNSAGMIALLSGDHAEFFELFETLDANLAPTPIPIVTATSATMPAFEVSYMHFLKHNGEETRAREAAEIWAAVHEDRFAAGVKVPYMWYEAARLYCILDRPQAAVDALVAAADNGLNYWFFELDPILEPARSQPGYAQVKAILDQRSQKP